MKTLSIEESKNQLRDVFDIDNKEELAKKIFYYLMIYMTR